MNLVTRLTTSLRELATIYDDQRKFQQSLLLLSKLVAAVESKFGDDDEQVDSNPQASI